MSAYTHCEFESTEIKVALLRFQDWKDVQAGSPVHNSGNESEKWYGGASLFLPEFRFCLQYLVRNEIRRHHRGNQHDVFARDSDVAFRHLPAGRRVAHGRLREELEIDSYVPPPTSRVPTDCLGYLVLGTRSSNKRSCRFSFVAETGASERPIWPVRSSQEICLYNHSWCCRPLFTGQYIDSNNQTREETATPNQHGGRKRINVQGRLQSTEIRNHRRRAYSSD